MEKRAPFFLTKLFRRSPQNSESGEGNGWGNTTNDTSFNGWGSSPGSTISGATTNGWVDELPEKHYKGWGSVSSCKPPTLEVNSNGWMYEQPTDEYNGWGSGSGSKCTTPEASSKGWMMDEPPKDGHTGWGSAGKCTTSKARSKGWTDELPEDSNNGWDVPEPEPINKQAEIGVGTLPIAEPRPVKSDSWAPRPVPSAPPLPEEGFSEDPAANVSDHPSFDFLEKDAVLVNQGKDSDQSGSSCVVCWEAPVEGACVPCGHMASCMTCLHEIESKQGSCPVCRAKIDKVMRIYAI